MISRSLLIQTLQQQGISDPRVLQAIRRVPRDAFIPSYLQNRAYENSALPIDCQQTISQPYIVALMTQALMACKHFSRVLEIGTGSGYQSAILANIFKRVFTIERIETLHEEAKSTLNGLGYTNIEFKLGDGALGWSENAPYDGIIVTAAASQLPKSLLDQLSSDGGIMIIPLGREYSVQKLVLIKKIGLKIEEQILEQVRFVPLISKKI
jgi:protein-L-isoaspartate(D-aspartate) O-methyltransferase